MRKFVLGIALMAMCGACGKDKKNNNNNNNDNGPTCSTDTSKTPLLIGGTFSITGGQAQDGFGADELPLVQQLVNDNCGLLDATAGTPLTTRTDDSANSTTTASTLVDTYAAAGAVAAIGAGNGATTNTFVDRAITMYHIPAAVNVGASELANTCTAAQLADPSVTKTDHPPTVSSPTQCWNNGGMFFRTRDDSIVWGTMAARYAHAKFPTRMTAASYFTNDATGKPVDANVSSEFTTLGGTVTQHVSFATSFTDADAKAQIQTLVTNNPDIIFVTPTTGTWKTIANAWAELSVDGTWTKPSNFDTCVFVIIKSLRGSDYSSASADAKVLMNTRASGVQLMWDASSPAYQAWYGLWTDYYPDQAGKDPVSQTRIGAFDAMMLFSLAITKAQSTVGTDIATAMREVANPPGTKFLPDQYAEARAALIAGDDIDYDGAAVVDFDEKGNPTVFNYAVYGFDTTGTQQPVTGLVDLDHPTPRAVPQ